MSAYSSEIVIGIDFGTTYSGVSWAVNGGKKNVRLINNWPNPQAAPNAASDKVPSVLSYKSEQLDKWGYNVRPADESFRWIKILLEPDSKYAGQVEPVKKSNELLGRLGKTAVEVVGDFLRGIWQYTMNDIQKKQGDDFRDIYALKVVITVPAMWSPGAKERTLQAAKAADLPDDIGLVTEPEAAALATLKDKSDMDELNVGDCFVVCDAGGGTVDLISYKVLRLDPLQIKECAIGSGELCGSVFVDIGFEKWVTTKVGEAGYGRLKKAAKKKMLQEFETQVKRGFDPANQQEYTVELRGVEELNSSLNVTDDQIMIPSTVMCTIFDHVCLQIEHLVGKQIEQVQEKGNKVKAILLVGGFGESGYLYDVLKNAHRTDQVSVLQVTGAWSSICRGATLWGLEHSDHIVAARKTVSSRLARYSYGIPISPIFNPNVHLQADRYLDESEAVYRARGQMQWMLTRGQEVDDDTLLHCGGYESVQVGFWDGGNRDFQQVLFYCEDDRPAKRLADDSVKGLCVVEYSISCNKLWLEKSYKNPLTRVKYRDCHFDIIVKLGSASITFAVLYQDELAAYCEAKYPENP